MPSSYIYKVAEPEFEHISVCCQMYAPNHLIILLCKFYCERRFKLSKLFCTMQPSPLGMLPTCLRYSEGHWLTQGKADGVTVQLTFFCFNLPTFSFCTDQLIYWPRKTQQLFDEKGLSLRDHLRKKMRKERLANVKSLTFFILFACIIFFNLKNLKKVTLYT